MASPKYKVSDLVLARDQGLLYDSRILKVQQIGDEPPSYFIHYLGWKSKWDKWVDESVLLKDNEKNRDLQKKLKESKGKKTKGQSHKKKELVKEEDAEKPKKKSKIDTRRETIDECEEPIAKVVIPLTLKKTLVDDWEMITQDPKKLVPLPREPNVAMMLKDFMDSRKEKSNPSQMRRYQELVDGLELYFDKCLPLMLLYRDERLQYDYTRALDTKSSPSEIYGAEHLLRLFVKMPSLLAGTSMSPSEISTAVSKMNEFIKFLQRNCELYFLEKYEDGGALNRTYQEGLQSLVPRKAELYSKFYAGMFDGRKEAEATAAAEAAVATEAAVAASTGKAESGTEGGDGGGAGSEGGEKGAEGEGTPKSAVGKSPNAAATTVES